MHLQYMDSYRCCNLCRGLMGRILVSTVISIWKGSVHLPVLLAASAEHNLDTRQEEQNRALISIIWKIKCLLMKGFWFYLWHSTSLCRYVFHLKKLRIVLQWSHCVSQASMQKGGKNSGSLITTGRFSISLATSGICWERPFFNESSWSRIFTSIQGLVSFTLKSLSLTMRQYKW